MKSIISSSSRYLQQRFSCWVGYGLILTLIACSGGGAKGGGSGGSGGGGKGGVGNGGGGGGSGVSLEPTTGYYVGVWDGYETYPFELRYTRGVQSVSIRAYIRESGLFGGFCYGWLSARVPITWDGDDRTFRGTTEVAEAAIEIEGRAASSRRITGSVQFFMTTAGCQSVLTLGDYDTSLSAGASALQISGDGEMVDLADDHHPSTIIGSFEDDAGGIAELRRARWRVRNLYGPRLVRLELKSVTGAARLVVPDAAQLNTEIAGGASSELPSAERQIVLVPSGGIVDIFVATASSGVVSYQIDLSRVDR